MKVTITEKDLERLMKFNPKLGYLVCAGVIIVLVAQIAEVLSIIKGLDY